MKSKSKSLYVHFPFCETKCHYCDFYSLGRERTRPEDPTQFETALHQEANLYASKLADQLDTIFFGGGTPSMTPASSMAKALAPLEIHKRLTSETEWTMEANPSSVDLDRLREYRALGINRISMGVQSMRDELLVKLERVHLRDAALKALDSIFEAGFRNVSVDLLCGVPGQTLDDLNGALGDLTRYPITHLSCYLLTLPKHHRMYAELPNEDTQLEHLLYIDQWMRARGFEHYEISNFAKPGKRARHNLNYWTGSAYLGLGPSAHSFDATLRTRWKNVSSLHKYAELLGQGKSPVEWTEELSLDQQELEKWMLGLRLNDGFPATWLARGEQKMKAQKFEQEGLIEVHPQESGYLRLTARGFALSDQIIAELA